MDLLKVNLLAVSFMTANASSFNKFSFSSTLVYITEFKESISSYIFSLGLRRNSLEFIFL